MEGSLDTVPIRKFLSTTQKNGVQALLIGGQACVFYGAAGDSDVAAPAGADPDFGPARLLHCPVLDLSLAAGFQSLGLFNEAFKTVYGSSPRDCRKAQYGGRET
jgi:AraC-like DNA-binding protein